MLTGAGDRVRCHHCNGGLYNWLPGDDPLVEHARWFPRCAYLLNKVGRGFVEQVKCGEIASVVSVRFLFSFFCSTHTKYTGSWCMNEFSYNNTTIYRASVIVRFHNYYILQIFIVHCIDLVSLSIIAICSYGYCLVIGNFQDHTF